MPIDSSVPWDERSEKSSSSPSHAPLLSAPRAPFGPGRALGPRFPPSHRWCPLRPPGSRSLLMNVRRALEGLWGGRRREGGGHPVQYDPTAAHDDISRSGPRLHVRPGQATRPSPNLDLTLSAHGSLEHRYTALDWAWGPLATVQPPTTPYLLLYLGASYQTSPTCPLRGPFGRQKPEWPRG